MKKFSLIAFLLPATFALAQTPDYKNSLAVTAGPNWFQQFSGGIDNESEYDAQAGFTVGVEYARSVSPHWQFTCGIRYNELKFKAIRNGLQWPSEWQNGQYVYDPSLPHSITLNTTTNRAWQLLAGLRWQSNPRRWRWYGGLETGITDYIETSGMPDAPLRLTVGGALGLEWRPSRFGVFVQPGARYVFQNFNRNEFQGYRFLIPAIEMGARLHF